MIDAVDLISVAQADTSGIVKKASVVNTTDINRFSHIIQYESLLFFLISSYILFCYNFAAPHLSMS